MLELSQSVEGAVLELPDVVIVQHECVQLTEIAKGALAKMPDLVEAKISKTAKSPLALTLHVLSE